MATTVTRSQVLAFRVRAQQLDRDRGTVHDTAILDLGVQDTGVDGGRWAMANRGLTTETGDDHLAVLWTLRGAPHTYRRADLPSIAAAVAPFSDADAGKRIYDAAKPLRAAQIGILEALDAIAAAMRDIVTVPTGKGDLSTALTGRLPAPYLRFCRPCNATHLFEMPFRLAAIRAGLELQAGTSPPVLQRITGFRGGFRAAKQPEPAHDVIRAYLHLLGPATPKHVAGYVEAPLAAITERWPTDVVEVTVEGEQRWVLDEDSDLLERERAVATRLLGPYDLFLQARDRELLIDDPAHAKALWPVLGRPGAVLDDGQIVGSWRPRASGAKLAVTVDLWGRTTATSRRRVAVEAERLARHRGIRLTSVDFA